MATMMLFRAGRLTTQLASSVGPLVWKCVQITNSSSFGSHRIYNGAVAKENQFPYQVSVRTRIEPGGILCGGAIIKENVILTAGHCVYIGNFLLSAGLLLVFAGSSSMSKSGKYHVRKVIPHPYLAIDNGANDIQNDIAILILRSDLIFNYRIRPLHIPDAQASVDTKCVLAGWGEKEDGSEPDALQYVIMKIISYWTCISKIRETFIEDMFVCADNLNGSAETAFFGDSGGPLACKKNDTIYATGLVSFGRNDIATGTPATTVIAFTNVYKYRHWIMKNSGNNFGGLSILFLELLVFVLLHLVVY